MVTSKRIGVLAGGTSAEREVSLRSGNAMYKALAGLGYNVVMIDAAEPVCEALKREKVEIAAIALHGGFGENGAIQGLLEVMGIPYTGSGVLASALAMDKEASKKMFLYHDIPVASFKVVDRKSLGTMNDVRFLTCDFQLPWVVKPVNEGSSVGVSIVRDEREIAKALQSAFLYGTRVIIEEYIKGREIQIGVIGDTALGGVEVVPSEEFYNYQAKYTPGLTRYILPPDVDEKIYESLKDVALRAHMALGCKGATRVDLILGESKSPYVLEVNTIPGMTETSLLPKIAKLSGMEFQDLVEEMVRLALMTEGGGA